MGYTTYNKRKGLETMRQHFQREWGNTYEILESSYVNLSVFYAAVRGLDGTVFAAVVLARHYPMDDWGHNFIVKDMDETVGPCEVDCPRRILELLSPTKNTYALEWREKCWENVLEREARPKVHRGDMVVFKDSIMFANGNTEDHFIFEKGSKFTSARRLGGRYHITKWRDRGYTVVPKSTMVLGAVFEGS